VNGLDVAIWLAAATVLYFGGSRVLARFGAWLEARHTAREAEREQTAQVLRDFFESASATDREVHGMTVPELMETREQFDELIGREWPDQT
jgi:hypothetical protein